MLDLYNYLLTKRSIFMLKMGICFVLLVTIIILICTDQPGSVPRQLSIHLCGCHCCQNFHSQTQFGLFIQFSLSSSCLQLTAMNGIRFTSQWIEVSYSSWCLPGHGAGVSDIYNTRIMPYYAPALPVFNVQIKSFMQLACNLKLTRSIYISRAR